MIEHNHLLIGLVLAILLLLTTAVNMLWTARRLRQTQTRVQRTVTMTHSHEPFAGLLGLLVHLGQWLRRFYGATNIANLRGVIQVAGFNPHRVLPLLLGAKVVFMVASFAIAIVTIMFIDNFTIQLAILGLGVVVGLLGPEWILGIMRRRFAGAVERGTPDALDLLVVCTEAGMGLESALERVSNEMELANRPMANILMGLLDDLRVLPNRRDAFINLGTRSGSVGLRRLGAMLNQSQQHGTSIGNTLRAVAEELRRDRMNKLEEKAVKLPAKLIFPMIGFIMPSLYIVLLGPSFMRLADSLSSFTLLH